LKPFATVLSMRMPMPAGLVGTPLRHDASTAEWHWFCASMG
jgi:hypothetical protein